MWLIELFLAFEELVLEHAPCILLKRLIIRLEKLFRVRLKVRSNGRDVNTFQDFLNLREKCLFGHLACKTVLKQ